MAKERAEATITTSDSIIAQEALKGDVNGRGHLTSVAPPTEQPNLIDIKSELSDNDLVDFQGLAMVPRRHASLLERACVRHPHLAMYSKRSLRWREFSYKTLGELLFFLTSTKRKEMTHKAWAHLQTLWEDTKGLGFDLSWLAPVMESDLSSSSETENICLLEAQKKVVKEHTIKLHCQLATLRMQLTEAEKELADLRILLKHAKKKLLFNEEFLYTDL